MVQEGEVKSAAETNEASSSHDDAEAADSQPVAERDPSERYSRVQLRRAFDLGCTLSCRLRMSRLTTCCLHSLTSFLVVGPSRRFTKGLMRKKALKLPGIKSGSTS